MKRVLLVLAILFSLTVSAQNYHKEGNVFVAESSAKSNDAPEKTQYIWQDIKGNKYPIYIAKSGSCYVIRKSKNTGKEYRYYLGPVLSKAICEQLGRKYSPGKKIGK